MKINFKKIRRVLLYSVALTFLSTSFSVITNINFKNNQHVRTLNSTPQKALHETKILLENKTTEQKSPSSTIGTFVGVIFFLLLITSWYWYMNKKKDQKPTTTKKEVKPSTKEKKGFKNFWKRRNKNTEIKEVEVVEDQENNESTVGEKK